MMQGELCVINQKSCYWHLLSSLFFWGRDLWSQMSWNNGACLRTVGSQTAKLFLSMYRTWQYSQLYNVPTTWCDFNVWLLVLQLWESQKLYFFTFLTQHWNSLLLILAAVAAVCEYFCQFCEVTSDMSYFSPHLYFAYFLFNLLGGKISRFTETKYGWLPRHLDNDLKTWNRAFENCSNLPCAQFEVKRQTHENHVFCQPYLNVLIRLAVSAGLKFQISFKSSNLEMLRKHQKQERPKQWKTAPTPVRWHQAPISSCRM